MVYRVLHTVLLALLTAWLLFAPLVWILRDGLGPGLEASSGWRAVQRFFVTSAWGPVLLVLMLLLFLVRVRLR